MDKIKLSYEAQINHLINNLRIRSNKYSVNFQLTKELSNIGIKFTSRKRKLACERTAQILTCLYAHKKLVHSEGVHNHIAGRLHELCNRLKRDYD